MLLNSLLGFAIASYNVLWIDVLHTGRYLAVARSLYARCGNTIPVKPHPHCRFPFLSSQAISASIYFREEDGAVIHCK